MKVAIRADASIQIGTGHVMRCLTLAEELRQRGANVNFICRELPGHLCDLISQKGFHVIRLPADPAYFVKQSEEKRDFVNREEESTVPAHAHWLGTNWESDAEQTVAALTDEASWEWLVVDHYSLDDRWESNIRPLVHRIMVIDDLADRPHDCDLLLDQNFYKDMEIRYQGMVPSHCHQLLGPGYALLRREFIETRKRLRECDGAVRRILVFFGGVDSRNMTAVALDACAQLNRPDISVDVVVGRTNPHIDALREQSRHALGTTIHVQESNIAELMNESDLAIGAGGTVMWERCCLGLPTVVWSIAENQALQIADAAQAGIIYAPLELRYSVDNMVLHVRALLDNPHLCHHLCKKGQRMVDGNGTQRVSGLMLQPNIHLRYATLDDSRSLFDWRNDSLVRRFSRNTKLINWEEHSEWIGRVLSDPKRHLLIGTIDAEAIGVLRFDISEARAEISLYLVPGKQGGGLGGALVAAGERWLQEHHPEVKTVDAEILAKNTISHKMFSNSGYTLTASRYAKGLH